MSRLTPRLCTVPIRALARSLASLFRLDSSNRTRTRSHNLAAAILVKVVAMIPLARTSGNDLELYAANIEKNAEN